jgi:hypothetical protein
MTIVVVHMEARMALDIEIAVISRAIYSVCFKLMVNTQKY